MSIQVNSCEMNSTHQRSSVRKKRRMVDFFKKKLQKYYGIGQTLFSKTAVSFTPKQPRVFSTRVLLQNHGMSQNYKKYFISKQTESEC
jgi:hypothetical protein